MVSAVLHMDGKTPHIHATVVPIVSGERRKARQKKEDKKPEQNEPTKKKYRKKPDDTIRLCADDIMPRESLKYFQDSYAETMQKYGLQRGIKESDTRHISTPQYYPDLYAKNEDLKEDIEVLQERKEEVYDSMRNLYNRKDEAREKFLDMDNYVRQKEKEFAETKARLEQLKQDYEPYKAQEELNAINKFFPAMPEQMCIVGLCEQIGLTFDPIRPILSGKTLTGDSVKLYSHEHKTAFPNL